MPKIFQVILLGCILARTAHADHSSPSTPLDSKEMVLQTVRDITSATSKGATTPRRPAITDTELTVIKNSYFDTDVPASSTLHGDARALALGDFDRFNELFKDVTIILPDAVVSSDGLELTIRNLLCSEVSIGDVQLNYQVFDETNQQALAIALNASPFTLKCEADYYYKFGFDFLPLRGEGRFTARTSKNSANVRIDLNSPSFQLEPPSSAEVDSCNTQINVDTVDFDGGVVASVLNLFESLISGVIEDEAETAACSELSSLGPGLFGDLLNSTKYIIDEWLQPIPPELSDPLYAEKNYVPNGAQMLNLQSTGNSTGDFLVNALTEVDSLFDTVDSAGDLGINVFLRENFLDENRKFVQEFEEFVVDNGEGFNPVIFEGHDQLTETTMRVNAIEIVGLDTLKQFNPFVILGDYTVRNELEWESLSVVLDLSVDMKPSSLPDSILVNPNPIKIVENITVSFSLDRLDINASLFLAIDEEKFDGLPLGALLTSPVGCFLSAFDALEVSGLEVLIGELTEPVLDGFVSPGLDRLISTLVEAAFVAYEPTLMRAIPYIFQGPARKLLKEELLDNLLAGDGAESCPEPVISDTYVDFRDLFLDPERAAELGGSGSAPYGIGPRVFDLIQNQFLGNGPDGLPTINEAFVRPFTERQSGTNGTMRFLNEIFSFSGSKETSTEEAGVRGRGLLESLSNTFALSLSDIRLDNLDTITSPLKALFPTDSASVLQNEINMGSAGRPLAVTARLVAGLFDGLNEIDIGMSFDSLSLLANISAVIDTDAFVQFPLGDMTDLKCWLAATVAVELDENGKSIDPAAIRGIALGAFATSVSSLALTSRCLNCTSPGTSLLSDTLQILDNSGAIETLRSRLPSLLESVAMSSTLQTVLDRAQNDAKTQCRSSPNYNQDAVKAEYGPVGFPILSAQSIDTLLFSAVLAAEVGLVVFAETQLQRNPEISDPLSAQKSFVAPEGVRILDWTNIGNSTDLGDVADIIFDEARKFLNGGDGGLFDIRKLFENLIDADGFLEFDTSFRFEQEAISFGLKSVRINGINTSELTDVLDPIGAQTLRTSVLFGSIAVEIVLSADSPSTQEPAQEVTLRFAAQDVTVDIATFLAFDLDKVGALKLGSLLDLGSIFNCIFSAAFKFEIPQMKIGIGSFSIPTIEGLMDDTNSAANQSIISVFARYLTKLLEALPIIMDSVGREFIGDVVSSLGDNGSCISSALDATSSAPFIDFRDLLLSEEDSSRLGGSGQSPYGTLVSSIFDLVKEELFVVDLETGLAAVNSRLLTGLSEAQSGTPGRLFFEGDLFNRGTRVNAGGIDAFVRLRAYDAYINNLDTIGAPLTLLDPLNGEPHMLNNNASVGISDRPLQLGLRFFFGLAGDEANIENDLDISIDFDTLQLALAALVKVSEESFMSFPIKDIANLQCWLASIPAPQLDSRGVRENPDDESLSVLDFVASVVELGLNISCIDCSGPRMPELTDYLSSGADSVTDVANGAFDFVTQLIEGNFLQVAADRALNDARKKCPSSPEYDADFVSVPYEDFDIAEGEDSLAFFVALIIVAICLFAAVLVIVLLTKVVVGRRHRKWLATLPAPRVRLMRKLQNKEAETKADLDAATDAMFQSDTIPFWWRMTMPIIILGNIGFFLSGHLSLGASVTVMASVGGETYTAADFFTFSMATSTIEIWNSGGKELAIMIWVLSFAWPYSKQLISLVLWFTPPNMVSVTRRGSILRWLDLLGKWSMVDIFVLVVTIVGLRVSIESPDVDFLPPDFYSIDLLVVPKWGLYANMTAQIISQLSSHFIIHYHRRIVHTAAPHLDPAQRAILSSRSQSTGTISDGGPKGESLGDLDDANAPIEEDTLNTHAFSRPHRGESDKLVVRRSASPILLFLTLSLFVLVILGCVLPSFSLNALGLVGVLVESGQAFVAADTSYSVFSSINLLFEQARLTGGAADFIGLGSLSVLLVLSVLIVPVLQSLVLLVQWFIPLSRMRRYRLLVVLEILQAWQYVEVYLLAVLVASWQIGDISEFLVNPYCTSLNSFFSEMAYYGILKSEDAQCFRANVSVEPTFYILFAAAAILSIVNTFVTKAVSHYFRDMDPEQNPLLRQPHVVGHLEELGDYETADITTDGEDDVAMIHPVPVLFTDQFRWLLHREDSAASSLPSNKQGKASEAAAAAVASPHEPEIALDGDAKSTNDSLFFDEKSSVDASQQESGGGYFVTVGAPSFADTTVTFDDFARNADPPADSALGAQPSPTAMYSDEGGTNVDTSRPEPISAITLNESDEEALAWEKPGILGIEPAAFQRSKPAWRGRSAPTVDAEVPAVLSDVSVGNLFTTESEDYDTSVRPSSSMPRVASPRSAEVFEDCSDDERF